MMKNWKKRSCVAAMAVVMSMAFTGCQGLEEYAGIEETVDPAVQTEIDLSAMSHGEEGYYYQNLKWGMTKEKVEQAVGYGLGKEEGYGNDGMTYYAPAVGAPVFDYAADSIQYMFNKEGELCQVAFQFRAEKNKDSLKTLRDQLVEKMTELYGEETEKKEDKQEINKKDYTTVTYKWNQGLGDGEVTSLQVASAENGQEPEIVVLGVLRYNEADISTEADK